MAEANEARFFQQLVGLEELVDVALVGMAAPALGSDRSKFVAR